ncbi:uncharacterized protein LOC113551502 [Rhopalosiphum maidis]|uniref:uncharacterized protein LOC113551502 n=1 Tax=Rhopalosiphum maidis TaxID=43146 RepID=UPI000EFF9BC7|nr:uncharacterized protein LOC113551502 [Rhopalosiphum maidis]
MDLEFDSPTVLIEDVTLPSLLTSFSTSTTSSVEFTSSESESETTRVPITKQKTYKGPIKSYSLADLTTIKSFKPLIREDSAIYSTETLTSAMTSRTESGIHNSNSYLTSLGKNKKKYAHVESKVKQYIKDIKDNEAKSKATRYSLQPSSRKQQVNKYVNEMIKTEGEEIINLKSNLKKMEIQLLEKNRLIEQLQYNYKVMENKYNSATNIILKLAKPSRDVLKFTENELIEPLSPGYSIPPPKEVWGRGYKLKSSNTLSAIRKENLNLEKENGLKVRKVKSGGDLINYFNIDAYKTPRDSRSAIQKVKLWQESLASTDVSEMDTDQDVGFPSPHSYSVSSNDLSLSSLEIAPVMNNKYPNKHECRSDSSGCGMSSTRVSKENTLVSGINILIDNNELCSPCEMVKLHSSTPIKHIGHNLYSTKNKNTAVSNKQNDESQKRRSSKKYRKTKSKIEESQCPNEVDEFMCQFKHCIGVINGVVTKMEESFMSQR